MPHALPEDPRAAVVEWRTSGGAASPAESLDLVVRADGSATVGERLGGGRAVEGRVAPERLDGLLDALLDEHGLFDIDSADVARRLAAARARREAAGARAGEDTLAVPLGPPYLDAGDTRILVAADGRRHEVAAHGLAAAAREYPEVPAVARLRAIEAELLRLAEEIVARAPR